MKKGFWRRFWGKSKSALLITLASIGFVFLINGFLDLLPSLAGGLFSIVVGFGLLLLVGWLGYDALSLNGKKKK